ncbi:IclR family transcriptional regulator domain-containing protein [Lysobacter sp. CA199]|uniref:IclR family transcriptional regulator domain-containing protein n=1 Tax=Lysobacter sp. CA199 TaxID=3455608 RepID=UPI003F8D523A
MAESSAKSRRTSNVARGRPPKTDKAKPANATGQRGLAKEIARQTQACEGDPNFMTSLARGLAVLSVFAGHAREVSMSQISLETGISRAAVRRVLYTLGKLGYVGEYAAGYVLAPRVLGIGGAYLSSTALTVASQPVLDALRDEVNESCSLGILDGDELLYVARAETVRIMSIGLRSGSHLPAYCTSMGRVLLAALPPDTLAGYLARTQLRPRTERTVTGQDELLAILDRVRHDGACVVDQELEIGLRSAAVPVRDRDGKVIAALNIGTQSGRVTLSALQTRLVPALKRAAKQLESVFD